MLKIVHFLIKFATHDVTCDGSILVFLRLIVTILPEMFIIFRRLLNYKVQNYAY